MIFLKFALKGKFQNLQSVNWIFNVSMLSKTTWIPRNLSSEFKTAPTSSQKHSELSQNLPQTAQYFKILSNLPTYFPRCDHNFDNLWFFYYQFSCRFEKIIFFSNLYGTKETEKKSIKSVMFIKVFMMVVFKQLWLCD